MKKISYILIAIMLFVSVFSITAFATSNHEHIDVKEPFGVCDICEETPLVTCQECMTVNEADSNTCWFCNHKITASEIDDAHHGQKRLTNHQLDYFTTMVFYLSGGICLAISAIIGTIVILKNRKDNPSTNKEGLFFVIVMTLLSIATLYKAAPFFIHYYF